MWKISIIIILGFLLRILGINWDQGSHLHPDERMLMMVADKIHFFENLNPEFFNYGSLPIYLLKGTGQILDSVFSTSYSFYGEMLYLGRFLSVLADVGVIFLIYKIAIIIFKKEEVALFSAFLYTVAFFPIQNSHFFIVDTFLNFFITLLFYASLLYLHKSSRKRLLFISIALAAAITSKFTAIIYIPLILIIVFYKSKKRLTDLFLFTFYLFLFTFTFMPFAYINYSKFIVDIKLQLELNSNPYVFPYTLQYVGTIPYWHYLKNIFLWGLGPVISILSILGLWFLFKSKALHLQRIFSGKNKFILLFLVFYIWYFLIIGNSAVKFMRYILPVYPFLVILAGYTSLKAKKLHLRGVIIMAGLAVIWTFLFLSIYTKEHTRISASNWIINNVPKGSTLAVEHWDDRLPIFDGENYTYEELTLYDQPDNEEKWFSIRNKLERSDYIIIASNRLYNPIQKLASCSMYKICFPISSSYYKRLFSEELGFKKVAEFTSYPGFRIGNFNFEINDDIADESFTVYDHPKIIIFEKEL
ncbi:MAG: glycosyltransferase family 39 protein [Patescibacteria group bacterium]